VRVYAVRCGVVQAGVGWCGDRTACARISPRDPLTIR
jgi:hypothetical protein